MESLPARKTRPSLKVEALEDRRMLSMFGPTPDGRVYDRPVDTQAETAPMSGGAEVPRDDHFDGPSPGPAPSPGQDDRSGSPVFENQGSAVTPTPAQSGCALTTTSPPTETTPGTGIETEAGNEPAIPSNPVAIPSNPGGDLSGRPSLNSNAPAISPGSDSRGSGLESIASAPAVLPVSLPSRAPSEFSITRSASTDLIQTTAKSEVVANPSPPGRTAADETLLALASASTSSTEIAVSPDQARGLVALNLPIGPGLSGAQARSGFTLTPSSEPANLATPAGLPNSLDGQGGETEVPSGIGSMSEVRPADQVELPEPHLADMIQSFLPFDRSAIDGAIDRFLEPFDDLASSMPELRGPMGLITASLATAATVVAVEVAIRVRRSREEELGADDVESLASFPGL